MGVMEWWKEERAGDRMARRGCEGSRLWMGGLRVEAMMKKNR